MTSASGPDGGDHPHPAERSERTGPDSPIGECCVLPFLPSWPVISNPDYEEFSELRQPAISFKDADNPEIHIVESLTERGMSGARATEIALRLLDPAYARIHPCQPVKPPYLLVRDEIAHLICQDIDNVVERLCEGISKTTGDTSGG